MSSTVATTARWCVIIPLPSEWLRWIDDPLVDHEWATLCTGPNPQAPCGSPQWQAQFAETAGLDFTRPPCGPPRTTSNK
jgi:hypothetical protein